MISLVHKIVRKCKDATRGLYIALVIDLSFRLAALVGLLLLAFGYSMWPLSELELAGLIVGWTLILITELQNTAIETALDRLHPEQHESIGRSKDIAAASSLVSFIFIIFVVIWIYVS
ncbi:diacylglycerol kinase [Candidatus Kaiserbacteria bacterium]|nr:diacylglycerol kinase [Candidatus Kaiserbacteria bacterium]